MEAMELELPAYEAPYRIADDTYVVGMFHRPPGAPFGINLNSVVVAGEQPMLFDTGVEIAREEFLRSAFSIVDPEDVRWVFISHEENDHAGNVPALVELCPNATFVGTSFLFERYAGSFLVPPHRQMWLNDGESLPVGDRTVLAVRPPVWDGPVTRGFLDSKTGVYWGVDSFCTPTLEATFDAADVDAELFRQGVHDMARMVSPWLSLTDPKKFGNTVDRIESLAPRVVANCHGPAVSGPRLTETYRLMRELPYLDAMAEPPNEVLQAMLDGLGMVQAA